MNHAIAQTRSFSRWWMSLKDTKAKVAIGRRIERIQSGNLGDYKALGGGLGELRIDLGAGYRVYFVRRGETLIFLLAGGDKSSQTNDIAKARKLIRELK
ncbi:type II toxin-antitoxin system RelE/ParE family toxin [Pseudomonas putida]|uniref:Type II toxin-antitoxin system RelE/ParE family toxin n=1 Tax=Pseudomonas putida TaxID=303 RepID=A0A4D6XBI5_PSEPU|nr:type II toxin-antitoxin system RelE/ParE family toxin [Pseudomonas putida]QCI14566.1 type II toxin-antitoxin system RelE/ParE family toxin [Pseudomonas putida]